jgi:mRNA interferase MazF
MNHAISTVIVAPLTSAQKAYPSRVACEFDGKLGQVALDQLRVVDKSRMVRRLGSLDTRTGRRLLETLTEMFSA